MDIHALVQKAGKRARAASYGLANMLEEQRNSALWEAASYLRSHREYILAENAHDMESGKEKGLPLSLLDRLLLNEERIEQMAQGIEAISALPDPVGEELASWHCSSGLNITRVSVPLGVVGVIYESRPNVTADAAALCLKAGNAVILRGGSESFRSSAAIVQGFYEGARKANLPEGSVYFMPVIDRAAVGEMLQLVDDIDVIIPRGGKRLIQFIMEKSKIPLFKHLEGICHTYIDQAADFGMARRVALNAKMRRVGICGATETILIHRAIAEEFFPLLANDLKKAGCEIRGDKDVCKIDNSTVLATDEDWDMEYLDAIVSIRFVDSLQEAIQHINTHHSQHTDAIITENSESAEIFLNAVDSAIVLVNASTQYADGGEFGMGAEIGISTGKLHARGPVGVEQLTSFKYKVRGSGHCRP